MTILTQGPRTAEFLLSEANGARSREAIVVNATAGKLAAGTLLAKLTSANAATPSAAGGNTGNGTLGAVTVGNDAITGTYVLTVTAAAANAGDFRVVDPFGEVIGTGSVGVEFGAGGLTFTLSDGSTDFIVGDAFNIAVNAGLGEWVAYDDDGANDGRRAATGILYAAVDATESDAKAVAIVRDAEVVGTKLIGLDANGQADLLALGIVVR
ncbi:Bacteriophage lambda head decoration protein D [Azotobacter beijerinckii]|uniref:Bacteriophage lambda head decoration protein D n=1 Tax=Azotobacter beijerinckii TaxID=170623 RepID=A0A1H9SZ14_9GAMM|nr:head decoration protein [Azotobacter beijerinckii]SEI99594.1 Bacteriophage lambda head decoration protein D [Azotobacter beijerinckii]SEJ47811.1 Bacteriophage lambda head decoration protein D [Azotobacter beijerinckii]SER89679.1 Bacteriophage lambda head decoration protein D [Azotobacter beijerinckii]